MSAALAPPAPLPGLRGDVISACRLHTRHQRVASGRWLALLTATCCWSPARPWLLRRPPGLQAPGTTASQLTPTSAVVTVTPPTNPPVGGGTWAAFNLTVCVQGADPARCLDLQPCPVDADPADGTACTIGEAEGLEQGATYTLVATACQDAACATGAKSQPATAASPFTVPFE